MTQYTEMMQELEALGTDQTRKIYKRHGASEPIFGLKHADLKALKKRFKKDHDRAIYLWQSGNHDARILATMIADPKAVDDALLEKMAADLDNYMICDAFSDYVSKTPLVQAKMEAWTQSDDEWIGTVGWNLLGYLAMKNKKLSDDYFEPYLDIIQNDIHTRKNRVRYSMNNALIAIGTRNDALEAKAIAIAKIIGEVQVDHGETNCQTPDAASYIQKTNDRRRAKSG